MKKQLLTLVVFLMASSLALGAQSLKDNPSYQKSVELNSLASKAFDQGDYDAAARYANQAKEYAALSDQYVEKMLAKSRADKAIAQAKAKMSWADGIDANTLYPDLYGKASDVYAASLDAYKAEDYAGSADKARLTVAAVDAIAAADADAAISLAKDKKAKADSIDAKDSYPDKYAQASDTFSASLDAYSASDFVVSAGKARDAAKAFDAITAADADAAIAQAKSALSAAEAIDAPSNYPTEYGQAKTALSDALTAYDSQDYITAGQRARDSVAALAGVKAKEIISWPAVYVVRLTPARRDCLWRIAEYSFIYNNPLKWTVIYEANKKTFRDPGNPNLIFPGQKLKIPSIRGETREGTFDPSKEYQPFPKK